MTSTAIGVRCLHCLRECAEVGDCEHCGGWARTEYPKRYFIYVCPYCGVQCTPRPDHNLGGGDHAHSCFHRHPGERGVSQPKLLRVEVELPTDFELQPIPHDRSPGSKGVAA